MPTAGAIDELSIRLGNVVVGNDEIASALEITATGPRILIEGRGAVALAGSNLGMKKNDQEMPPWTCIEVKDGDELSFINLQSPGLRTYLCASGGIDVPLVMESRSTYLRGKIGGLEGRALKSGDILSTGTLPPLFERTLGFACPKEILPEMSPESPICAVSGPQDDAFTEECLGRFFSSKYRIMKESDRMGYRLEGPILVHKNGADIISEAIPLGAVQVPGHGQPIVMLADRQTTGGYVKIAIVCRSEVRKVGQRLPGEQVSFKRVTIDEALEIDRATARRVEKLNLLRASYLTRPTVYRKGHWKIRIGKARYDVSWEEIR